MLRCRVAAVLVTLVMTVATTVGCTDDPTTDGSYGAPDTPKPLELPFVDDAMTVLLAAGPTIGDGYVGKADVAEGEWRIDVNCRGGGVLTVDADPLVAFEVPCTTEPMEETANQFDLDDTYEVTVTVSAPRETEWALLVLQ